jgi:hypothetical protein
MWRIWLLIKHRERCGKFGKLRSRNDIHVVGGTVVRRNAWKSLKKMPYSETNNNMIPIDKSSLNLSPCRKQTDHITLCIKHWRTTSSFHIILSLIVKNYAFVQCALFSKFEIWYDSSIIYCLACANFLQLVLITKWNAYSGSQAAVKTNEPLCDNVLARTPILQMRVAGHPSRSAAGRVTNHETYEPIVCVCARLWRQVTLPKKILSSFVRVPTRTFCSFVLPKRGKTCARERWVVKKKWSKDEGRDSYRWNCSTDYWYYSR